MLWVGQEEIPGIQRFPTDAGRWSSMRSAALSMEWMNELNKNVIFISNRILELLPEASRVLQQVHEHWVSVHEEEPWSSDTHQIWTFTWGFHLLILFFMFTLFSRFGLSPLRYPSMSHNLNNFQRFQFHFCSRNPSKQYAEVKYKITFLI